jgi:hypothetical protein
MNLSNEFWGQLVAFILTLMVFSYLVGDNPLYRFAIHIFLGVAAAYVTIIALQTVMLPRLVALYEELIRAYFNEDVLSLSTTLITQLVPWILAALVLLRAVPQLAPLGNFAIAFMVGVGAALAVGGALVGTLIPQVIATWDETNDLLRWAPMAVSTILVLSYFFYTGRPLPDGRGQRPRLLLPVTWAGQGCLTVALGALYAGALAATFAIFVERVGSLYLFLTGPDILEIISFFIGTGS